MGRSVCYPTLGAREQTFYARNEERLSYGSLFNVWLSLQPSHLFARLLACAEATRRSFYSSVVDGYPRAHVVCAPAVSPTLHVKAGAESERERSRTPAIVFCGWVVRPVRSVTIITLFKCTMYSALGCSTHNAIARTRPARRRVRLAGVIPLSHRVVVTCGKGRKSPLATNEPLS